MSLRLRTTAVVAGLAAALAIAAGCASVPTVGPVTKETLAPAQRDGRTDISITDVAPKDGDTPVQTVRGFIEAMKSYQPQYQMARQFLTDQAEARWKPGRRILVYEGSPIPTEEEENVVMLTGEQVGEVGDDGAWRAAPKGKRLDQELTLKRVKGEWRIDRLPDQVLMTRTSFEAEFKSFNLYFFDPSFEILVPDPVFLPLRSNQETALANALVRGPTHWLTPVVRSAVPPGSRLSVRSVQINDKTARVDLTESSRLTTDQHRRLATQLDWTLRQVGAEGVRLSVDKVPLEDIGDPGNRDPLTRYDPAVAGATQTAYAFENGNIYPVGGTELLQATVSSLDYTPRAFAVALHGNSPAEPGQSKSENAFDQLTIVGKDNRSLIVYPGRRTSYRLAAKYEFNDIRSLSTDRTGGLWVVDNDNGVARILMIDEQHRPSVVAVEGLRDKNIVDLKVSRDGTRVAMLVERKVGRTTRTSLQVGLVERGEQLRIRGLREVETGYAKLSCLAWSETTELVALAKNTTDEVSQVLRVTIDGSQRSLVNDAPVAPAAVTAAPGRPLIVVDEEKQLYVQDERAPWQLLGQARLPTYAG